MRTTRPSIPREEERVVVVKGDERQVPNREGRTAQLRVRVSDSRRESQSRRSRLDSDAHSRPPVAPTGVQSCGTRTPFPVWGAACACTMYCVSL